jgi:pimeloyl-ACP methyl ester carboxylesterase
MPTLAVNGTTLYYEDTGGPGEPLLFSHGLLWSARMFTAQIEAFRPHFRVIAWDHRGQGRSADHPERSVPVELVTADALALMDALGLPSAHFAGLSMGGFVGMRLAARHPDRIRSLILLETSAGAENPAKVAAYRQLAWVARWIGVWTVARPVMKIMFSASYLADPARSAEAAAWKKELLANRRTIDRAVHGIIEREAVAGELGNIRAPTTVIVGEEDVATPPAEAEAIVAAIRGATLRRIPGAGHTSTVEQPERVIAAMKDHFRGIGALP